MGKRKRRDGGRVAVAGSAEEKGRLGACSGAARKIPPTLAAVVVVNALPSVCPRQRQPSEHGTQIRGHRWLGTGLIT